MKEKTIYRVVILLIIIGLLVTHFILARSAFIAGARVACHNTQEDYILSNKFKCEPRNTQVDNIPTIREFNFSR